MKRFTVSLAMVIAAMSLMACAQAAPAPAPTAAPAKPAAPAPAPTAAPAAPAAAAPTKAPDPTKAPAAPPTAAPAAKKVSFPEKGKAISLIMPYAAGGAGDTSGRMLAEALEKELGTSVQMVNKVGAGSQVGVTEGFLAKPDGYTLVAGLAGTIIVHAMDASRSTPYKTHKDFSLVSHYTLQPHVLMVRTDSPWKSLKDLLDYAKANPGKVKVGTPGLLTGTHIAAVMLEKAAGVEFAPVHFDGGAQYVPALLGGHIDASTGAVSDAKPHVKSGTVRVLAVFDEKPSPFLPEGPTAKSQGFDIVSVSSIGYMGPRGMPGEIVDVLSTAIKKVSASEALKTKLADFGMEVLYLDPAGWAKYWDDMERRTAPAIKEILAAQAKK